MARERVQAKNRARDDAESAESSSGELRKIVAGDVFYDFAAAAGERAIGKRERHANNEVAERTEAQAQRTAIVGGEHTADRGFFRPQWIEREPLAMLRDSLLQFVKFATRFDGNSEVSPGVIGDFVQPRRGQNQIRPRKGIPPFKFRAATAGDDRESGFIRKTQDLGKLSFIAWRDDYFRLDARDRIGGASGMDVVRADERDELVAKCGVESR